MPVPRLPYLLPVMLAWAAAAGAEPASAPPSIEIVRHTEEYGYLRRADPGAAEALSPWAPLKYIPLNADGDVYLTLGAEVRLRYEWYGDNNWGEGPQDTDGYLWARALPLADLHVGSAVRFFGQLISAFVYDLDVPKSPVDEDRLDVLQGFVDVRLPLTGDEAQQRSLTLRLGRQLMTYGSGRLINVRYGPNVLQAFDAAKASIERARWRLDAFYARPADARLGEFDDRTDDRQSLWAVYGTLRPGQHTPTGLDLYYIGYLNEDAVFAERTGRELRHTVGARVFGEAQAWDWNFELFYQFGDFDSDGADGDIAAWSVASDTGRTFEGLPLRPRVALRANVISGDRNPDDPDVQTFNPLFPKGKYFGELSPVGPSNLIHVNPYVTITVTETLRLTGNVAFYWRETTDDGIYGLGGDVVRGDGGSDDRHIGTQVELVGEQQVNRHLSLLASYSIFAAGGFVEDTGAHETIHFVGLELLYRF